ncbi:unnamed protein product [Trichobilharzia szidati]|nr:unnamed protein product [Trichobilharzia szidati]
MSSNKRPSFMVHDLLQQETDETQTLKYWQLQELLDFQTHKKSLLDQSSNNNNCRINPNTNNTATATPLNTTANTTTTTDMSDLSSFYPIYHEKTNLFNNQHCKWDTSSQRFNVYTDDWNKHLSGVQHKGFLNQKDEDATDKSLLKQTINSLYAQHFQLTDNDDDNPEEINDSYNNNNNNNSDNHNMIHKKLLKKSRKARTAFTDYQLTELEQSFDRQKYLGVQDRMELAARLSLSDRQVKTWYQNRRTKWKRQTAVGLELMAEAGNFVAVQRLVEQSPFWAYHPTVRYILSNIDFMHSSSLTSSTLKTTTTPTAMPANTMTSAITTSTIPAIITPMPTVTASVCQSLPTSLSKLPIPAPSEMLVPRTTTTTPPEIRTNEILKCFNTADHYQQTQYSCYMTLDKQTKVPEKLTTPVTMITTSASNHIQERLGIKSSSSGTSGTASIIVPSLALTPPSYSKTIVLGQPDIRRQLLHPSRVSWSSNHPSYYYYHHNHQCQSRGLHQKTVNVHNPLLSIKSLEQSFPGDQSHLHPAQSSILSSPSSSSPSSSSSASSKSSAVSSAPVVVVVDRAASTSSSSTSVISPTDDSGTHEM